jgi:DNA-binding NarL/FixJ family response regulator
MDQMSNNAIPLTKNPDLGPKSKQPLSNREQEIANLVIQGYRNSDIAEMLSISELTVNDDLSGIFGKLVISDRLELLLSTMHDRLMSQS